MFNVYASVLKNKFIAAKICSMNTPNKAQAIRKNYQLGLLLAYLHNKNYRFTTISPASHKLVNSRVSNVMAIG